MDNPGVGIAGGSIRPELAPQLNLMWSERQWYVAQTRSRHEKLVSRQVANRGMECFLPLYRSMRQWKDRRKEVELPLFPGYVFAKLTSQERRPVLEVPGVVRFVSCGPNPASLPEDEMEALRNGLEQRVFAQPHAYLQLGCKVRIVRGPMAGAQGLLVRKRDRIRVVISIDVIMRSIAVEVDAGDVIAC
jgi:transcription antitermination factor NusG